MVRQRRLMALPASARRMVRHEKSGDLMQKHQMTPLSKGGTRTVHAGKGSKSAPMAMRQSVTDSGATAPGASMNNYAKATPMPGPAAPAASGLGSGTWPGVSS